MEYVYASILGWPHSIGIGSNFESEDTSLQVSQSVSDLTVGPGQGRDRLLHLSHSRRQLLC